MFRPMIESSSGTFLSSITQVIEVDCHDMDPYYATGVHCYKGIFICRVGVHLYFNIQIKFITNSYDFKI
jgi:hypothetical protein